MGQVW
jgi:serine/threonine protein kinase